MPDLFKISFNVIKEISNRYQLATGVTAKNLEVYIQIIKAKRH